VGKSNKSFPSSTKSDKLAKVQTLGEKFANNWQKKKILAAKQHQFKAFDLINNLTVTQRVGKTIGKATVFL
jgi:hypothetical protein